MDPTDRQIAVLTGDLVNSTGLGTQGVERAFAALQVSATTQRAWMGEDLRFTRFRGDGWQVALRHPEGALRSALAFRAALRSMGGAFDSYITIAVGSVKGPLLQDLNAQTEPVFATSGRTMDVLKERSAKDGMRMLHADYGYSAAASLLADHISQSWTPAQAQALLPFLDPNEDLTDTEVALRLGKSRQAVSKALKAAGKDVVQRALAFLEAALRSENGATPDD